MNIPSTMRRHGMQDQELRLTSVIDIIKGFACHGPPSAFEFMSTMNADHKPEIEEDGVVYTQDNKE